MSYPDADEVYRVLKDFEQPLMSVHLNAWDRLVSNPDWPTLVFSRTGTGMMHDFIVQEAAGEFDEMAGVRRIAHDKSVRYLFKDRVLLRFKHGSARGLGSNIDTRANDDFIDAQVDLMDMPEAMKVELLWYENRLRTKLDRVEVTARDGKRRLWAYPMGGEPDIATLPFDTPFDPTAPARTASLVTLKPVPKTDTKDDE